MICIFVGCEQDEEEEKKKGTLVDAAGTIVVDVKKPARIILRNDIIILFVRSISS